jgi:integrase
LRDKAFILTLGYTGLRVSEICELRRHQFDSDKSQIVANTNLGLSLPTSAVSALIAYLSARRKLDSQQPSALGDLPLFARHDKRAGSRILSVSRWTGANIVDMWVRLGLDRTTRVALEKAHMNITPHTFRHYFVFNALASTDKDISSAQRLARHGDRSTTRRYLQQLARSAADETST